MDKKNYYKLSGATSILYIAPFFMIKGYAYEKWHWLIISSICLLTVFSYYFSFYRKIYNAGNHGAVYIYVLALTVVMEALLLIYTYLLSNENKLIELVIGITAYLISWFYTKHIYLEYKELLNNKLNKIFEN